MRLAILDRGHSFCTKALFALIRIFSRQPVLDVIKLVKYRPDFYGAQKMTHEAMRGPSAWSVGDRELMAVFVAKNNECEWCARAHTAVAKQAYRDQAGVAAVLSDLETAPIEEPLRATLRMLRKMTREHTVTADDMRTLLSSGVSRAASWSRDHQAWTTLRKREASAARKFCAACFIAVWELRRGSTGGLLERRRGRERGNMDYEVSQSIHAPLTFSGAPRPARETKHLAIGCFVFERLDQIDFTDPFEVFSRIPDATVQVIGKTKAPVRDVKGLILTPGVSIAEAGPIDVLLVPGGLGQQALMEDEDVLSFIRAQAESGRLVFSVCTGALLCGAAGILRGRMATTHWAAWELLHYYGAIPTKSRVVVDGNYISTAGVTAGLDGALVVASLLRGDTVAQEIQLDIEYAPDPVFHSGAPHAAPPEVIKAFFAHYGGVKASREAEARRFAKALNSPADGGVR